MEQTVKYKNENLKVPKGNNGKFYKILEWSGPFLNFILF